VSAVTICEIFVGGNGSGLTNFGIMDVVYRAHVFSAQHPHREPERVRISSPHVRQNAFEGRCVVGAGGEKSLGDEPGRQRDERTEKKNELEDWQGDHLDSLSLARSAMISIRKGGKPCRRKWLGGFSFFAAALAAAVPSLVFDG